jgi:hypothetical protein
MLCEGDVLGVVSLNMRKVIKQLVGESMTIHGFIPLVCRHTLFNPENLPFIEREQLDKYALTILIN